LDTFEKPPILKVCQPPAVATRSQPFFRDRSLEPNENERGNCRDACQFPMSIQPMVISKNRTFIFLTQLRDRLLRRARTPPVAELEEPEHSIRKFCSGEPRKRALMALSPNAWREAIAQHPEIRFFNAAGLTYYAVKALNECGYVVDIIDRRTSRAQQMRYDLCFAHGPDMRAVIEGLPAGCFILHYASGAYWREFIRLSRDRYDAFAIRKGLPPFPDFVRSLSGAEEGEEFVIQRANASFNSGPRTIATYGSLAGKMELLYLAARVETDLYPAERDFDSGRRNFIYVAGTGGNIQKGMDILLEAFARMPELNLYIYCKVEPEVSRAYARELSLPNIHYIYHLSRGAGRKRVRKLLGRINFTISAPIDTGPGTAMLGSLGLGLIPVGYIDIEADDTNSVLTDSCSIEAIMDTARQAAAKSPDWCSAASAATLKRFERLHQPSSFGANFKKWLQTLGC